MNNWLMYLVKDTLNYVLYTSITTGKGKQGLEVLREIVVVGLLVPNIYVQVQTKRNQLDINSISVFACQ